MERGLLFFSKASQSQVRCLRSYSANLAYRAIWHYLEIHDDWRRWYRFSSTGRPRRDCSQYPSGELLWAYPPWPCCTVGPIARAWPTILYLLVSVDPLQRAAWSPQNCHLSLSVGHHLHRRYLSNHVDRHLCHFLDFCGYTWLFSLHRSSSHPSCIYRILRRAPRHSSALTVLRITSTI